MRELPYETVITRRDGTSRTFTIRLCGPEDFDAVMALQEEVSKTVDDPGTFAPLSAGECEESLRLDFCCCAECDGRMAGLTMMVINRPGPRNVGTYLGYTEEQLKGAVTMEVSFIAAAFRGYGLQPIFFGLREEKARELGATEALTTISPDNEYSLNNALKSGYTVAAKRELYGGHLRNILRKPLK